MQVTVIGATGNVGTGVIRALVADDRITSIIGVARRVPTSAPTKVTWRAADIATDPLAHLLEGSDALVHLGWELQPSWDEAHLHAINVGGARRLFEAAMAARVPAVVYASSIGAYAPGPVDRPVDEGWPTTGIPTSQYSRHKVAVERMLDRLERDHPDTRVVRMRKALVFQRSAASAIGRLFIGPTPFVRALGAVGLPVVPSDRRFTVQAVHSDDVGQAYREAVIRPVRGSFNLAADPVLSPEVLSRSLGSLRAPLPAELIRFGARVTHALHLQVSEPGWIDLALGAPVMATERAHAELGWAPRRTATAALGELLDGFRAGSGTSTPRLLPHRGGECLPAFGASSED
jgi:UDP-glucose 4-epimerase